MRQKPTPFAVSSAARGPCGMTARMDSRTVLAELQRAGTPQNRKVYARHGAAEPMFGVSFAVLYALQKRLGTDQALAEQLWASGNHDARILATLIADGDAMTAATLKAWLRGAMNRALSVNFAQLVARCRVGLACALRWIDGKQEYEQAVGWLALGACAADARHDDATFAALLPRLQRELHALPNYARYGANACLIGIGGRPSLTTAALAVAAVVGAVDVDHGQTGCKTPLATDYIRKMAARRDAKAKPNAKADAKAAAKPRGKAKAKAPAAKRSRAASA